MMTTLLEELAPVMNPSVLLVEDDASQSELIQRALGRLSIDLIKSFNGQDAIEYLDRNRPHLLILDMLLPVRSGLDVLDYVFASPHLAAMPVLVMSAQEQFRYLTLRPGDMVLIKPIELALLRDRVTSMLSGSAS